MTYVLCMQRGPNDGTQVEWESTPQTFKFPTFKDRVGYWYVQFNLFPMVPCYVYARNPKQSCSCIDGINHHVYTYVGRDEGDRIIT